MDKAWKPFKTTEVRSNKSMATTLTITLTDSGSITINGPLTNKLLCWGLLTAAEKLVETYEEPKKNLVEIPEFVPPDDVKAALPTTIE